MHTTAKLKKASSEKATDLGYLFYSYIKTTERLYPGILHELTESALHENTPKKYTIGGRLFLGLDVSIPNTPSSDELAQHQADIDKQMDEIKNKAFFDSFKKFIHETPLQLNIDTITRFLEKPAEIARDLLTRKYISRLDKFLKEKIPLDGDRNKTINFIYDALFFRCLAYTFSNITAHTKSGRLRKTNQMKLAQKFITSIYSCESDTPANTLFALEANISRAVDSQLATTYFARASLEKEETEIKEAPSQAQSETSSETESETMSSEEKSEAPKKTQSKKITLPGHIKGLSIFIEKLNAHYEFIVCPSATMAALLKHFIALIAHLQKIRFQPEVKPAIEQLSSLVIHCIETHLSIIKQNNENLLRTESIITTLKKISLTNEVEQLTKLHNKIMPDLQKNLPPMQKPSSDNSPPKPMGRAPLPTSPSIADFSFFIPPIKKSASAPETTEFRKKNSD